VPRPPVNTSKVSVLKSSKSTRRVRTRLPSPCHVRRPPVRTSKVSVRKSSKSTKCGQTVQLPSSVLLFPIYTDKKRQGLLQIYAVGFLQFSRLIRFCIGNADLKIGSTRLRQLELALKNTNFLKMTRHCETIINTSARMPHTSLSRTTQMTDIFN
jgi:hypothetical protein